MNKEKVIEILKKYKVVGVYLFIFDKIKKVIVFCWNIVFLVGIDEECVIGILNGVLIYYLKDYNIILI